jgi:uncharacterized membrane protein
MDSRFQAVDYIRGIVMLLMAIDHVRVYSGIPSWSPEPAIFFTRWVTHFCAPAFAFFAGTSAYLYGARNTKQALVKFLLSRGFILVILELTLIRFLWAFNISSEFILAGVIWMLGWCMILLTLFVSLKPSVVGIAGVGIILGQQVFGYVPALLPEDIQATFGRVWEFVYPAGFETFPGVNILYVLVPWIGVMAAGYGFGYILQMDSEKRKKHCYGIGLTATLLFVVVGGIQIVNSEPGKLPFLLSLLNQNKYPASILFLMMTLGPSIALVPYAERAKGWFSTVFVTIGRVPFFYYLLHVLIIHLSALIVNYFQFGDAHQEFYLTAPYTWLKEEYIWSLPLLYVVFIVDAIVLYFLCKWYASYKQRHSDNMWLKYI